MRTIENWQIKKIYAYANQLGIHERDNKEDNLHLLVQRVTNKNSIKDLEYFEAVKVANELKGLLDDNKQNTTPSPASAPGMVTERQRKYIWVLIYKLISLDITQNSSTPAERLAGAVNKILGLTATKNNPLAWVTFEQGEKLIEYLKRYVSSAKRKANNIKKDG